MKETFGNRVDNEMRSKGWSIGDLAEKAGLSYLAIKKIIDGKTTAPNAKTVHRIAKALGIPSEEAVNLIYGE